MSGYLKILERPYRVYLGEQEYIEEGFLEEPLPVNISWTYLRSFRTLDEAEKFAEKESEYNQFMKIEKKETE